MPNTTIKVFDLEIPHKETMTAMEWEEMEVLIAAGSGDSPTRHDLKCLAIFVKTRVDPDLDRDAFVREYMQRDINQDELSAAIEVLTLPFFVGQRARAARRIRTQAAHLTPSKIRDEIKHKNEEVTALRQLLSELERAGLN